MIDKDTMVEDLLELPGVIAYCVKNGVSPFTCSGGYPQSLGKLLEIRKIPDPESFIKGLNELLKQA